MRNVRTECEIVDCKLSVRVGWTGVMELGNVRLLMDTDVVVEDNRVDNGMEANNYTLLKDFSVRTIDEMVA